MELLCLTVNTPWFTMPEWWQVVIAMIGLPAILITLWFQIRATNLSVLESRLKNLPIFEVSSGGTGNMTIKLTKNSAFNTNTNFGSVGFNIRHKKFYATIAEGESFTIDYNPFLMFASGNIASSTPFPLGYIVFQSFDGIMYQQNLFMLNHKVFFNRPNRIKSKNILKQFKNPISVT